jgi:hypothetical protein
MNMYIYYLYNHTTRIQINVAEFTSPVPAIFLSRKNLKAIPRPKELVTTAAKTQQPHSQATAEKEQAERGK